MAKKPTPAIVITFENFVWAHSPSDWIIKTTYFNGMLYLSGFVHTINCNKPKKIGRTISVDAIKSRSHDISGLAYDIVDEMKATI